MHFIDWYSGDIYGTMGKVCLTLRGKTPLLFTVVLLRALRFLLTIPLPHQVFEAISDYACSVFVTALVH